MSAGPHVAPAPRRASAGATERGVRGARPMGVKTPSFESEGSAPHQAPPPPWSAGGGWAQSAAGGGGDFGGFQCGLRHRNFPFSVCFYLPCCYSKAVN
eukprot:gene15365-biopygen8160